MPSWKLVFIAGVLLWGGISSFIQICGFMKNMILFNRASQSREKVVRGTSTVYKFSSYVFIIIFEIVIIIVSFRVMQDIKAVSRLWFFIIFFYFAIYVLNFIIHIMAISKEKYVYLTTKGLFSYTKFYSFSDSRFAWEESGVEGLIAKTLHVYDKKSKSPYTVRFEEQLEAEIAHKITDEYLTNDCSEF